MHFFARLAHSRSLRARRAGGSSRRWRCRRARSPRRPRSAQPQAPKPRDADPAAGQARLPGRPLGQRRRLRHRAGAQGPGPVHGLARDRGQPRRQERLRRLLEKRRDRDLHAQPATGTLTQPQGQGRLHRRQRRQRLRRRRSGSTARTRSRSAPTAATSTRPRAASNSITSLPPQPEDRRADASCRRRAPAASPALPIPVCASGRALVAPDVVVVSPDGKQRLRRLLLRQRGRRLRPRPGQRRADPARRTAPAASPRRPPAAPPASPWSRSRGWRSAATAPASTPPRALSNAVVDAGPRPSDRRPHPGERRQRLHRRQRAHRLHHRRRSSSGANAVAVSPGGDDVYVDLAVQQQRHLLRPLASTGGLTPEGRHRRLPDLPALRRLLLRPRADRAGGAGGLARRRATSTSPPSTPARSPSSTAARSPARSRRSRAAPAAWRRTRCRAARRGRALQRRQLDRAQPRRPLSLLDLVRKQRGRHLQEEQMSESDERKDGLTRKQLLGTGASAAAAALLLSQGAGVERALAAAKGRRRRRRRDEHHPLPHRPGAGDPALPAELAAPEPAGDAAAAPARAQLRTRLHQRLHVLAGALDPDERLLPRPARGQVHARGRHARPPNTRRSNCRAAGTDEPRPR